MSFEFGASRACGPKHTLNSQAGREQLSQDGRERSIRREISEEIGRLPMGDTGKNQLLNVFQDGFERLALRRSTSWERLADLPRLDL